MSNTTFQVTRRKVAAAVGTVATASGVAGVSVVINGGAVTAIVSEND